MIDRLSFTDAARTRICRDFLNGQCAARTRDLLLVRQVLYQLS